MTKKALPQERSSPLAAEASSTSDFLYEVELIRLLAKLERSTERIRVVAKRPLKVLGILESQINEVAAFSERLPIQAFSDALDRTLKLAGQNHPQTALIHVADQRADLSTAVSLYRHWHGQADERTRVFHEICEGLLLALDRMFSLFGFSYEDLEMSTTWEEMYGALLGELREALGHVDF